MGEQGEGVIDQAKRLIEQGQHQEAIELLEPWLAENSDDSSAWAALGAAHSELENWTEAEKAAREVVRLRPDSARDWCNLGMVLRKGGKLDEAQQAQDHALSLDWEYDRARTELEKLNELRAPPEPDQRDENILCASEPSAPAATAHKRALLVAIVSLAGLSVLAGTVAVIIMLPKYLEVARPAFEDTGGAQAESQPRVALEVTKSAASGPHVSDAGNDQKPDGSALASTEPRTAKAQDLPAPGQSPQPDEARSTHAFARSAFRRGLALYHEGRYAEARPHFVVAYRNGRHDAEKWVGACERRITERRTAEGELVTVEDLPPATYEGGSSAQPGSRRATDRTVTAPTTYEGYIIEALQAGAISADDSELLFIENDIARHADAIDREAARLSREMWDY